MDKAAKDAAIAPIQLVPFAVEKPKNPMQVMCKLAFPRQHQMLKEAPCILLPLFKNNGALFHAKEVFGMMDFASIWCVIENIFLAATNEGLACTMHMPHGNEQEEIMSSIHCPQGYILPCVIGIGYAADDAEYPPQVNFDFESGIHWNKWRCFVECIGLKLKQISNKLIADLDVNLKKYNLTTAQLDVLGFIQNRSASKKEIGEFLGVRHSTVIDILRKLEEKDMIHREVSPSDARVRMVVVTDKARRILSNMQLDRQQADEMMARMLGFASPDALHTALTQVYEAMLRGEHYIKNN